jgi:hypothetical protein
MKTVYASASSEREHAHANKHATVVVVGLLRDTAAATPVSDSSRKSVATRCHQAVDPACHGARSLAWRTSGT